MNLENFTDAARVHYGDPPDIYHERTAVVLLKNTDPTASPFLVPIVVALNENLNDLRTQIMRMMRLDYCPNLLLWSPLQVSGIVVTPPALLPVLRLVQSRPGQDELHLFRP